MLAVGRGLMGLLMFLDGVGAMTAVWPNGVVRSATGGAVIVPAGPNVVIGFSGSYGGQEDIVPGDKVSIIKSSKSCIMRADQAEGASGEGVLGFVALDGNRTAIFDFRNVQPKAGYQVCVCPLWEQIDGICPDGAGKAAALTVTVKPVLAGLKYKNVIGGFVAIPLQGCGAECAPALTNEHVNYVSTQFASVFAPAPSMISLIPLDASCVSTTHNLAASDSTRSGHLECSGAPTRAVQGFGVVNGMAPSMYQVCVLAGTAWDATGIVVALQDSVSHIRFNAIPGVLAYAPRLQQPALRTQELRVCRGDNCAGAWGSSDVVSFVSLNVSCIDTVTANTEEGHAHASGHLLLATDGALQTGDLDRVLRVGGDLRLCVRRSAVGAFEFSGVHLHIQEQLLALEINGVRPRGGQRVSAPRTSSVHVKYERTAAPAIGDSIALVPLTANCHELCIHSSDCDTSLPGTVSVSGALSAPATDGVVGAECMGDFPSQPSITCRNVIANRQVSFANIPAATYQVCARPAAVAPSSATWPTWQGTGLTLEVQGRVTSLEINHAGGSFDPSQGQRAVAPLAEWNKLRYMGTYDGAVTLAFSNHSGDCEEHSDHSADMWGRTRAVATGFFSQGDLNRWFGHPRDGGGEAPNALSETEGLGLGTFQLCLRPTGGEIFLSTGVSITLVDYIQGLEVNGLRPNRGLSISVPRITSSELTMFRASALSVGDMISIIARDRSCFDPAENPDGAAIDRSGYLRLVEKQLIGESPLVFEGIDAVEGMAATRFKVCFRPANATATTELDTGFVETGITIEVQESLTHLKVNIWQSAGFTGNNRGVRVSIPYADRNMLRLPRAGTVSIVAPTLDCTSAADNPATDTDLVPQYLFSSIDSPENEVLYFLLDLLVMPGGTNQPGTYQICFASPGETQFKATGVALTIQGHVTGLIVNTVRASAGRRGAIPRGVGSEISVLAAPQVRTVGHANDTYSLIYPGGDCRNISDNPVEGRADASGWMRAGKEGFALDREGTNRLAGLEPGTYLLCFRVAGNSSFIATGVTLRVQDDVRRLVVNGAALLRSSAPQTRGNLLGYCRDADCEDSALENATLSLIPESGECEDTQFENPEVGIAGRSGHLVVLDKRGALPQVGTDAALWQSGFLGLGNFQVCFKPVGGIFRSTGLALRLHDDIIRLEVNGVSPNNGLRLAIPKTAGNETVVKLGYATNKVASAGDAISMIPLDKDCSNQSENPKRGIAGSTSGYMSSTGLDRRIEGTGALSLLETGQYQVCFRMGENGTFLSTGLSAVLQDSALYFKDESQPFTASVFKKLGETFKVVSKENWIVKASLILPRESCENEKVNRQQIGSERSGWLDAQPSGLGDVTYDISLPDISEEHVLSELTYQLCLLADIDMVGDDTNSTSVISPTGWISTGLAVRVEFECAPESVNTTFAELYVKESQGLAGVDNAVHIIFKTDEILPAGNILRVAGLLGTETVDAGEFVVAGNTVTERSISRSCLGNGTCSVSFENFVETGTMLLKATLTINVTCTDMDSMSCGEGLDSVRLTAASGQQLNIFSSIDRGPWDACVARCDTQRTVLQSYDVLPLVGKAGDRLLLEMAANDQSQFFTCDSVTLHATASITVLVSELSSSSLVGTWSQISGQLSIPFIPFEHESEWLHVTLVLGNAPRRSIARRPTVSVCPILPGGAVVAAKIAEVLPVSRSGVLESELPPRFVSISLEPSTSYTLATNRYTLFVKAQIPALLPSDLSVTIAGLVGTETADDFFHPLVSDETFELRQYECYGDGLCAVTLDATPSEEGALFHRATLDIEIYCTDFFAYPSRYIKSIQACTELAGVDRCPVLDHFDIPDTEYSRGPWQGCSDPCMSAQRKVMQRYDVQSILDRYTYGKSSKRFTLAIAASGEVQQQCFSSDFPGGVSLRAVVRVRIEYARHIGKWSRSTGELIVQALPVITECSVDGPIECFPDIKLSFEVTNAALPHGPITPIVSAKGGGLFFEPTPLQPLPPVVFRQSYRLLESIIGESTRVVGDESGLRPDEGLNTISVYVKAETKFPAGTTITISGLIGTLSPSKTCIPVLQPSCGSATDCIYSMNDGACQKGIPLRSDNVGTGLAGSWDQTTGTITLMIQPSFQMVDVLAFSFKLRNAPALQPAASVTFAAVGPEGSDFIIEETPLVGAVLSSGLPLVEPVPLPPALVRSIVQENSKIEYEENELRVDAATNVPVPAGTLVELGNLNYTRQLDRRTEGSWIAEALGGVTLVPVSGEGFESVAQWQDSVPDGAQRAWMCDNGGWAAEYDPYYIPGARPGQGPQSRAPPVFRQQNWCLQQEPNTVWARTTRCFAGTEEIKITFKVTNSHVLPLGSAITKPIVSLKRTAVQNALDAQLVVLPASVTGTCSGGFKCLSTIQQDPTCRDPSCTFLPPHATLRSARLSLDLACSNFEAEGALVQRVTACRVPTCDSLGLDGFSWNPVVSACCKGEVCEPYACIEPVTSFTSGPWLGCANNCSDTRRVLERYDVKDIICNGVESCTDAHASSLVFFVAISSAADKVSCGSGASDATYLKASWTLDIEKEYSSVAFAAEYPYLHSLQIRSSTDVANAESVITATLDVEASVKAGSTIVMGGLVGSGTPSSSSFAVRAPGCDTFANQANPDDIPDACSVAAGLKVRQLASWDQVSGTLTLTITENIARRDLITFAFRLRNPSQKVQPLPPTAEIRSPSRATIGPQSASKNSVVLSSSEEPLIYDLQVLEALREARLLNEIVILLRCNYHLEQNDPVTISGLTGSLTEDALLRVTFPPGRGATVPAIVLGVWEQALGALVVPLDRSYVPDELIEMKFTIRNALTQQIPVMPEVTLPSPISDQTLSASFVESVLASDEIATFSFADIEESTIVVEQANTLTVQFRPNVNLVVGSVVVIEGMRGSLTPSGLVTISLGRPEACEGSMVDWIQVQGQFDRESGRMLFAMPNGVEEDELVRIQFTLFNPLEPRDPQRIFLSATSKDNLIARRELRPAFGPSEAPQLITGRIGESTREPASDNTISFVVQVNIDLAVHHEIEFGGLSGVSFVDLTETTAGFESPSFDDAEGKLTLIPARAIAAGTAMDLRFVVANPAAAQAPMNVTLRVTHEIGDFRITLIPETVLEGAVLSANLSLATVISADMEEESLIRGSGNILTARIRLGFALSYGAELSITNLTNTGSEEGGVLQLSGSSAVIFGGQGGWTYETGALVLRVEWESVLPSGEEIELKFKLLNPYRESSGVTPAIASAGFLATSAPFSGQVLSAREEPLIVSASIEESVMTVGEHNTLTVRFTPNADVPAGSSVTVSGLGSAQDGPDRVVGPVALSGWDPAGVLVVQLSDRVLHDQEVSFSFKVFNAPRRQSPTPVTVELFGMVGEHEIVLPARRASGLVLMSMDSAAFHYTDISETARVRGALNHIEISLRSNVHINAGTVLTISGLIGSLTETSMGSFAIEGGQFLEEGTWDRTTGTVLAELREDVAHNSMISLAFDLLNPFKKQPAVVPFASTEFIPPTAIYSAALVWNDGVRVWRGDVPPEKAQGEIFGASLVYRWTRVDVVEQNAVAGQKNLLTFKLTSNAMLLEGAAITVSGLSGTAEDDNPLMQIVGTVDGVYFSDTGAFLNNLGTLIFDLDFDVPVDTLISFSFRLKNSFSEQVAQIPSVELQLLMENPPIIVAPQAAATIPGSRCCLSSFDVPRFITATVRESNNVPNEMNVLYFTLHSNVPLKAGATIVTIKGMRNTEQTGQLLPISNSSSLAGSWTKDSGTLTFTVDASMFDCSCIESCSQNRVSISVQLRNPLSARIGNAPRILVKAANAFANFVVPFSVVSGRVLMAEGVPKLHAAVFESSNVRTQLNTITVSLFANVALTTCQRKWLESDIAWNPEAQKLLDNSDVTRLTVEDVTFPHDFDFDLGQIFRIESISVVGYGSGEGAKDVEVYYWNEAHSVWNRAAAIEVLKSAEPSTTPRWPAVHAQRWRLRVINNHDMVTYSSKFSVIGLSFFGCRAAGSTVLRISNLPSPTPPTNSLPLASVETSYGALGRPMLNANGFTTGSSGVFRDGALEVEVFRDLKAFDMVGLSFTLRNAAEPQLPAVVAVGVAARQILPTNASGTVLSSVALPQIVFATIEETSQLQSDVNTLTIKVKVNVPLEAGQILIVGMESAYIRVPGPEGQNNPYQLRACTATSPPCIDFTAQGANMWQTTGGMPMLRYSAGAGSKPVVELRLVQPTEQNQQLVLVLRVANPAANQLRPMITTIEGSAPALLPSTRLVGEVMQATKSGLTFTRREITHSSSMAGALNTITIRLSPGAILASGVDVIIDCLSNVDLSFFPGGIPDAGLDLPLLVNEGPHEGYTIFDDVFLITRNVDTQGGDACLSVTLFITADEWYPGEIAEVAFRLQNSATLRGSGEITVVATEAITIRSPMCSQMDQAFPSNCRPTDAMTIDKLPGFLAGSSMEQMSATLDENNALSLTLRPQIELTSQMDISISGLQYTQTPEFEDGIISGISHLLTLVSWSQGQGVLVVRAKEGKILNSKADPDVSFTLQFKNSAILVSPQNVSLCVTWNAPPSSCIPDQSCGSCGLAVCDIRALSDRPIDPSAGGACPQAGGLSSQVLGILHMDEITRMMVKTISQSSLVAGQDNLITITLQPNRIVRAGVTLTMRGMTGVPTPTLMNLLEFTSSLTDCRATDCFGTWRNDLSQASLVLRDSSTNLSQPLVFSFVIRNPLVAQAAPVVELEVVISSSRIQDRLEGSVLQSTEVPEFISSSVHELTRVKQQLNTLTFTSVSNTPLSAGTRLTFSDLLDRNEPSVPACVPRGRGTSPAYIDYELSPIQVTFGSSDGFEEMSTLSVSNTIRIEQDYCAMSRSIVRARLPHGYAPGQPIIVKISLLNARSRVGGGVPKIAATGCRATLSVHGEIGCAHNSSAGAGACVDCSGNDLVTLADVETDHRVLTSGLSESIEIAEVSESTPALSQPNTISVRLKLNTAIFNGGVVQITGFAGSQSPTTLELPIEGPSAHYFGDVGLYDSELGHVNLTATMMIPINKTIQVAFTLVNRGVQSEARCTYGLPYCSGMPASYNLGKACPTPGKICAGVCRGGQAGCSEGSDGDCSQYTQAQLSDRAVAEVADDLCVGGFCRAPTNGEQCPKKAMVNGSAAYKSSLTDTEVEPLLVVVNGQLRSIKGIECVGSGASCVQQSECVAPNTGKICTNNYDCTGPFNPTLSRDSSPFQDVLGPQRCIRLPMTGEIALMVSDTYTHSGRMRLSGQVFGFTSPGSAEFTTRKLSESTTAISALNRITVSIVANFLLNGRSETQLTLSGFPPSTEIIRATRGSSAVPLLPFNQETLVDEKACQEAADGTVTCGDIGAGFRLTLQSARLSISVPCPVAEASADSSCLSCEMQDSPAECALVSKVTVAGIELSRSAYATAPCLSRAGCLPDPDGMPAMLCEVLHELDVRELLDINSGQAGCNTTIGCEGFSVMLTKATGFSKVVANARARLTYAGTTSYAEFKNDTGQLLVREHLVPFARQMGPGVPQDRVIAFSFLVRNAAVQQAAPSITLLGESGLVRRIGLCDDQMQEGCVGPNVPSTTRAIMTGRVLTSGAAPALVRKRIIEASQLKSVDNMLMVDLKAPGEIAPGSVVRIEGLLGAKTPDSDSLAVTGVRVVPVGRWRRADGSLEVTVNAAPATSTDELLLQFAVGNPDTEQPPRRPTVAIRGPNVYGGRSERLQCVTVAGCTGVLAAGGTPRLTALRVLEKNLCLAPALTQFPSRLRTGRATVCAQSNHFDVARCFSQGYRILALQSAYRGKGLDRYAGDLNRLSFFLEANIVITGSGTRITLAGLPAGDLTFVRNPGAVERYKACTGEESCSVMASNVAFPGTIPTGAVISVWGACDSARKLSTLTICGTVVATALLPGECAEEQERTGMVVSDLSIDSICPGDRAVIRVMLMESAPVDFHVRLTAGYVFDTTAGAAVWDAAEGAHVITVAANASALSPGNLAPLTLAFALQVTNPPARSAGVVVRASATLEDGLALASVNADATVLRSGVRVCQDVELVGAPGATSARVPNEPGVTGVYRAATSPGRPESCLLVIQPPMAEGHFIRLDVDVFDIDPMLDSVVVFDGDSPYSPKMGELTLFENPAHLNRPGYFTASKTFFAPNCAVSILVTSRVRAIEGADFIQGVTNRRRGVAVSFSTQNPAAMDHVIAMVRFADMVDDINDEWTQLKLRKVMGDMMQMMYTLVRFDAIITVEGGGEATTARGTLRESVAGSPVNRLGEIEARRSLHNAGQRRATTTSDATIRVLASSNANALDVSNMFAAALDSGQLTVGMQAAGIEGSGSLQGFVQVYRCGIELNCDGSVRNEPIVQTSPIPNATLVPSPFPIMEVASLLAAMIAGPVVVVIVCLGMCVAIKVRDRHKAERNRAEALAAWEEWKDDYRHDLLDMSDDDRAQLFDHAKVPYDDDKWEQHIDEITLHTFKTTKGMGKHTAGIWLHLPREMWDREVEDPETVEHSANATPPPTGDLETGSGAAKLKELSPVSGKGQGDVPTGKPDKATGKSVASQPGAPSSGAKAAPPKKPVAAASRATPGGGADVAVRATLEFSQPAPGSSPNEAPGKPKGTTKKKKTTKKGSDAEPAKGASVEELCAV